MKLALAFTLTLAATGAAAQETPAGRTIVEDRAALQRLRRNSGITLQWISFETARRGHVRVSERNGLVRLTGRQDGPNGASVRLDGEVLSIGSRSFTLQGRILIRNAPDQGRECVRDGTYEFRVTQNRRYWRLQQMTVCDGLTDYVDIYY
jgi:hypothetical protein